MTSCRTAAVGSLHLDLVAISLAPLPGTILNSRGSALLPVPALGFAHRHRVRVAAGDKPNCHANQRSRTAEGAVRPSERPPAGCVQQPKTQTPNIVSVAGYEPVLKQMWRMFSRGPASRYSLAALRLSPAMAHLC
jgi:hypothetical protein